MRCNFKNYPNFQKSTMVELWIMLKFLLKGLFHPGCLARVVSLFAFVAAISWSTKMATNKGKPRDDTCKASWMKETLRRNMP